MVKYTHSSNGKPFLRLAPPFGMVAAADTGLQQGRRLLDLVGFPGAGPAAAPAPASPSPAASEGSRVIETCIGIVVAVVGLATIGYIAWLARFAIAEAVQRLLGRLGLVASTPAAGDEAAGPQQGSKPPQAPLPMEQALVVRVEQPDSSLNYALHLDHCGPTDAGLQEGAADRRQSKTSREGSNDGENGQDARRMAPARPDPLPM
ncbi:hypothetical protein ABPG77_002695 [Micractinium sp. CCAP 211/92]